MHSHNYEFENGVECSSKISGFKGVIISCSHHLNGCDRYYVQPKVNKDGEVPDGLWFDEGEVAVKNSTKKIPSTNSSKGGFASKVR